jgi:hypothetical protein
MKSTLAGMKNILHEIHIPTLKIESVQEEGKSNKYQLRVFQRESESM